MSLNHPAPTISARDVNRSQPLSALSAPLRAPRAVVAGLGTDLPALWSRRHQRPFRCRTPRYSSCRNALYARNPASCVAGLVLAVNLKQVSGIAQYPTRSSGRTCSQSKEVEIQPVLCLELALKERVPWPLTTRALKWDPTRRCRSRNSRLPGRAVGEAASHG